jgi:hypothetical protein
MLYVCIRARAFADLLLTAFEYTRRVDQYHGPYHRLVLNQ